MKKIILVAFLLLPIICFSQSKKPIDSFLGIKFGSTKAEVVRQMKALGIDSLAGQPDTSAIFFPAVQLEDQITEFMVVQFVNGKAYMASFKFKVASKSQPLLVYEKLCQILRKSYGDVDSGTGLDRFWFSKKDQNHIHISMDDQLSTVVDFTDRKLFDLAVEQMVKKKQADF